jgi:DNA polymerase-3 subunit delta'
VLTINSAPGFKKVKYQGHLFELLSRLLQNQALPHAILLSGMAGIGKESLAIQLAMACNCLKPDQNPDALKSTAETDVLQVETSLPACGNCSACRKLLLGNHPDLTWVKPQGAFIRIDQIRELIRIFSLKSYEGNIRIAIVLQAHRLNPSAGNALLKILEEPPDRSLLILTTENPAELLPTILSRCQHMKLKPVSSGQIQTEIQERYKIDADSANAVAKMSGGSPSRACAMIESGWLEKRNWLFQRLSSLKQLSVREILLIAKTIASQEAPGGEELEMLRSWYRDIAIAAVHPLRMIHRDWKPQLQEATATMDPADLDHSLETIGRAQKTISGNANTRLCIEAMMLELHARGQRKKLEPGTPATACILKKNATG